MSSSHDQGDKNDDMETEQDQSRDIELTDKNLQIESKELQSKEQCSDTELEFDKKDLKTSTEDLQIGNTGLEEKDLEGTKKSPNSEDDLSNDTLEEELKLRWDDDDELELSEDVTTEADKSDTVKETPDVTITDQNSDDNLDIAKSSGYSSERVSKETSLVNKEHRLNKPDAMLEIPTQELIDMEGFDDEFDKFSDKESNEDTDNNLSELLSKVNADIADSLCAMDSSKVDSDIELSSDADENLEVSLDKEENIENDAEVTEQHEDLGSVPENALVDNELAEIRKINSPSEVIDKASLSKAIAKEVEVLADTLSSIDELQDVPTTARELVASDDTSPPKSDQRQENIHGNPFITNMKDSLEDLDTQLEVDSTPSEKREKEINFKVSTLISNIEEEMQLLDSQEEQVLAQAEQKQTDVKLSTIINSIEEEIQLLDSDEKTEPPFKAINSQKSKVKVSKSMKKTKQCKKETKLIDSVANNMIEKSKNVDELENSNKVEVEKSLQKDTLTDNIKKDDINKESKETAKETKPKLKEEDEIALAIKAIEQSNDNYEPPMPTVVKVTDALPEIPKFEERNQPSDDVEMGQDDLVLVGDESEVSVIPDSDDDDQPVLVPQDDMPENVEESSTADVPESVVEPLTANEEQTTADITESSQGIDTEMKVGSTDDNTEIADKDMEIKDVLVAATSLNNNELNNEELSQTTTSITEEDSSSKSEDGKSTTVEKVCGNMEMSQKNITSGKTETRTTAEIEDIHDKVQPIASNTDSINTDTDNITKSGTDSAEKPIDNNEGIDNLDNLDTQPSTSADLELNKDLSNDVPENSDSLGLLTESTRVMDDDEEQDDDDDSEDFSPDDESNLMTAENSDESNPEPPIDIQKQLDALADIDDYDDAQDPEVIDSREESMNPEVVDNQEESMNSEVVQNQARSMNSDVVKSQGGLMNPADDEEGQVDEVNTLKEQDGLHGRKDETMECDIQLEATSVQDGNKKSEDSEPTKSDEQGDVEMVKLSDNSDNEADNVTGSTEQTTKPVEKEVSPSKTKNLTVCSNVMNVLNIVDLEESSEDEIQVVKPTEVEAIVHSQPGSQQPMQPQVTVTQPQVTVTQPQVTATQPQVAVTQPQVAVTQPQVTVTQPQIAVTQPQVAVTQPQVTVTHKQPAEPVNVDTATSDDMIVEVLEEEVLNEDDNQIDTLDNSEVFNVESDEDETQTVTTAAYPKPAEEDQSQDQSQDFKCVNSNCQYVPGARCYLADASTVTFYNGGRKGQAFVCEHCLRRVEARNAELIEGIRNCTSLLELEMGSYNADLVEISDSDSDNEDDLDMRLNDKIGDTGAKFVEEELEQLLNDTWKKMEMDTRLADTETVLQMEMKCIEKEANELRNFLNECQATTDKIRNDLYASFPQDIKHLPPLVIYDTPDHKYCYVHSSQSEPKTEAQSPAKTRLSKRRLESATADTPAKRAAIPMGYTSLDDSTSKTTEWENTEKPATVNDDSDVVEKIDDDDNTDISVVRVIPKEAAPAGLPAAGEAERPPLRSGMQVYATRNSFGCWARATVLHVLPKGTHSPNFTSCKVKFNTRNNKSAILPARCLAYVTPANTRMTIGTRVIALFKDKDNSGNRESYYSGIVAEVPNPVNSFRYLIFFDDGYAQYARHADTRLVCECSNLVWEEVHPFSREFVREYLMAYPERPMVRLHPFQSLKTEWNGKWWSSRVVTVDASLAQVHFPVHNRYEWIYRGSTRLAPLYLELQAAERHRTRAMPRTQAHTRSNMPVVEYTRFDEETNKVTEVDRPESPHQQRADAETNRRAVAKKSTSVVATSPQAAPVPPRAHAGPNLDNVTSRVVYYTPKNAVKPHKLVPHVCGPKCKRTDVLGLKELRTYNPLAKPLLSGWERQIVRYKGQKAVAYRAPCGRRIRDVRELHRYLRAVKCELPVDLFDFGPYTHCLAEFVLNKCLIMKKDLSQGKENVPVPCVNYYDQSLPEFCTYSTERTPTAGVPLNLDPEFLCGCDCEDDCEDKSKCACWKLTLEGARTIGLEGDNVGYVYKRLPEPLPSGIYECNSRCKCKHTCLNRVAQHPLQLKLQVFKTLNRGWGIRALNDVPKGSFLCVYAGNLLTDATANLDGLNEGDEYLAELDYIEVVEQMKEGYEEDIPEALKKLDLKQKQKADEEEDDEEEEEEESSEEESKSTSKTEMQDDDFRPGYIGLGVAEFSKRLRKRNRDKEKDGEKKEKQKEKEKEREKKKEKEKEKEEQKKEDRGSNEDDCITISDDDEVREPSRFSAAAGMGANEFVSKYRSVRTLFGEDEACYIMDAKVQGNIGRYLNHSCSPNVFVQNVFVDTHDPRFPWVAFFALSHVRAGTELTWNYNYDVGSVPGKALYCYCGATNCRGRLL